MKNKFVVFFLLFAIVAVLVLVIVALSSLLGSVGCSDPGMMKIFDFFGIENDLCFVPAFGANTGLSANTGFDANQGFAVNPYQTGNTGRDMAVIVGASVAYILREVKYFTLFIVALTVLALNACSIIVYFIFGNVAKPTVGREETQKNEELGMGNQETRIVKEVKSCLPLYWQ